MPRPKPKQRLCAICKTPIEWMGPGPWAYWRHSTKAPPGWTRDDGSIFWNHLANPG